MMQRLTVGILFLAAMFLIAMPTLAQSGDPLEHAILLADIVGWIMAGLAVVLAVSFSFWARRSPR